MRKAVQLLLYASRAFAVCAVLAGLAMGFLNYFFRGFVCFDNCPAPDDFFARLVPGTINMISPCVALESLMLVTFLAYCAATRQPRRAITVTLVLLAGGLVGVAALTALMMQGQATLPVTPDGILVEGQVVAWVGLWGLALMAVAGVWSGALAYLQWAAE